MSADHFKTHNRSTCIEVIFDVLVEQLKDKIRRVMFVQQEEDYFEVDGMKKKIIDDFNLDAKE